MVFSSIQFLFIFMPVFFTAYYAAPVKFRNIILLCASAAFYIAGAFHYPLHIAVFVLSIITDYLTALFIEKNQKQKKLILTAGILINILNLSFFKYFPFIIFEAQKLFPELNIQLNIVLPIGISFYTFQGISYIADVYKGKIKAERSLLKFSIYISMFEQLIAGPIIKYSDISENLGQRNPKPQEILKGAGTFIFGLGLKVLLANPLGKLWADLKTIGYDSISTPLAWMGLIAFSIQIYLDFFGYSVMAIGLGEMLGFKIPKNFDFPYLSRSMTEFWRRWHITLGSWFREYIYIPLGGNRKGKCRTVLNLLAVWLLTGIWHGAGYNFILWGLLLFTLITLEKYITGNFLNRHPAVGHLYMLFAIPLTWAVFAIEDTAQLFEFFSRLFPFFGQSVFSSFRYDYMKYLNMYYPFIIFGFLFCTRLPYKILKKIRNKGIIAIILLLIFSTVVYCILKGFDDPFLYFRF